MVSGFALIPEGAVLYFIGTLLLARAAVFGHREDKHDSSFLVINLISISVVVLLAVGIGMMVVGAAGIEGFMTWVVLAAIPVLMAISAKVSWGLLGPKDPAPQVAHQT
ncbi:MAG: hypothetical protein NXI19_06020 [Alphaproteobacteria bacterium]|nr:hypothetical protein [Alphaproteobacteria bacterium]